MSVDDELERHRAHIRSAVLEEVAGRRARRRRLALAGVAGASLLLVAGVAIGATKLVTVNPVVSTGSAACYTSDDVNTDVRYFNNGDGVPFDVVELCSQFWQYGQFGQTPPVPDNDFSHEYPVPDIAVCLTDDGLPSGFPIWDDETEYAFCYRLGLPVYDGP